MSLSLLPEPKQSYEDSNGRPLNGGKLYTYAAGTTTPKATYQDAAGTIPNTNPIILNERGEAIVYGSGNYRFVLKNAFDATIWDRDNINSVLSSSDLSSSTGASLIGWDDTTLDVFIKSRLGRVVDSIAQLRALDKTKYTRAFVTGYYTAGDGGGGQYWYDPADTTSADNGGALIVASDGGRWKLERITRISAKQFGAKGDNATDDTATIQAAVDWLYSAGGGELYFPAGTYMVTSIVRNFAATITINICGSGKLATFFKKTGASTTPIFDWSSPSNILTVCADFRDFSIIGNAKAHDGIRLTQCAGFDIRNVDIGACATAVNSLGSLVFTAYNCRFHDNSVGYKCAISSGGISCNLVTFYSCQMVVNSTYAVDMNRASAVNFIGCDFEANGTASTPSTGAVIIRSGIAGEFGYSNINFDKCWFEGNHGTGVQNEATGNPAYSLVFRDVMILASEGGNAMTLGSSGLNVVFDGVDAPTPGDTATLNGCGSSSVRDSVITLNDTSLRKYRENARNSSGVEPMQAWGGANGGLTMATNGNVLLGVTTPISGLSATLQVRQVGNTYGSIFQCDGSGGTAALFSTVNNGGVGSITTTSTTTAYNTSSDYRLKDNVVPMVGCIGRLMQLKPSAYRWKVDGSDGEGFIAHELQAVVPLAVTGDKDGEPMQAVDYSKVVPLLVGALQEAIQRIETLEGKLP